VAQKRNGFASVRHLVPATFVVAAAVSLLVTVLRRDPRWAVAVLGPYAVANGAASVATARRARAHPGRVALAYAVLHTSYGTGFLSGLWRWRRGFLRRPGGGAAGWAARRYSRSTPAPHTTLRVSRIRSE
jgi:hypothetical protein